MKVLDSHGLWLWKNSHMDEKQKHLCEDSWENFICKPISLNEISYSFNVISNLFIYLQAYFYTVFILCKMRDVIHYYGCI